MRAISFVKNEEEKNKYLSDIHIWLFTSDIHHFFTKHQVMPKFLNCGKKVDTSIAASRIQKFESFAILVIVIVFQRIFF